MRPGCNWRFQPDARTNFTSSTGQKTVQESVICLQHPTTIPSLLKRWAQCQEWPVLDTKHLRLMKISPSWKSNMFSKHMSDMGHLHNVPPLLGISHLQLRLPPKSKAILGARPHRCGSPYLHAAGDQSWALVNGVACWTHKMLIFFLAAIHLELPVNQFWTMVSHIEPCLIVFVWPAQHFQQLRIMSCGRRGIWSTLWIFPVAISPGRRSTWRTLWSKSGALLSETCNHNVRRAVKKWEI